MKKFDFISNEEYRKILERDYSEVCIATESKALKSAAVLSGSIVEALLTNFLIEKGYSKVKKTTNENVILLKDGVEQTINIDNAGLNNLINQCYNEKFISQKTYHLMHYLRDYRNYIHPKKEIREKITIEDSDIGLFKSLIDTVILEISEMSAKTFGPTHDQLLSFIIKNGDAPELFGHIIKKAKSKEDIEKLIINLIPDKIKEYRAEYNRYCDYEGIPEPQSHEESLEMDSIKQQIQKLYQCYHIALIDIDENIKKKIAYKYIETVTFEGDFEKSILIDLISVHFFKFLSDNDRNLIRDFYISRINSIKNTYILDNIEHYPNLFENNHIKQINTYLLNFIRKEESWNYINQIRNYLIKLKEKDNDIYSEFIASLPSILSHLKDIRKKRIKDRLEEILIAAGENISILDETESDNEDSV